ncbi:MAG: hypothetical protein IMZ55_18255, partial [Acidobacteria bacterium]|nr:hypothetical protein [Acidobacteriota bacterium]
PEAWAPFDLKEYAALVADRKRRILIEFTQPMDGKATVVVEDEGGHRIRNLVSGAPTAKGRTRVEWDGLDEQGRVVRPGRYTWRAISHPGIVPEYLFSFGNDGKPPWRTGSGTDMWGPDHSCLMAAAAGPEWTFFGGSCAESGYAIVAVDAEGTKRMQYNPPMGTGIEKVALATDGEFLYAAHDGFAWGQHVDRQKPDWKAVQKLTLTRFDVKSGKVVDFPGGQRFAVVATHEVGPGSLNPKFAGHNLAGLAALGGKLYVSARAAGAVLVVDAKTAKPEGEVKVDAPGALAAAGDAVLAVSGSKIVRLVPRTSGGWETTGLKLPALASAQGIAVDAAGRLYVSDGAAHTVRVFDAAGKPVQTIGKAGGPYAGKYDPEILVNPRGIAVAANGWLWVTEDRWNPKRTVAWDTKTGKVVREKFGPTSYGASGGGFDSADASRWIGQGALWSVDIAKQSAACAAILEREPGHMGGYLRSQLHYKFVHQADARSSSAWAARRPSRNSRPTGRCATSPSWARRTGSRSRATGTRRRRSSRRSRRPIPTARASTPTRGRASCGSTRAATACARPTSSTSRPSARTSRAPTGARTSPTSRCAFPRPSRGGACSWRSSPTGSSRAARPSTRP